MKINERGYWENPTAEGHGHDEGLAKALVEFFQDNNFFENNISLQVYDIGCGDGYYTNYITHNSVGVVCLGFDGNPNTRELGGTLCSVMDFTKPQKMGCAEWVLCLEVGEHIPEEYEDVFLKNLDDNNSDGIVLSWAVRGQGGDGHVNCKNNDEVIAKVTSMGYTYDAEETRILRNSVAKYPTPCYWFRDTLMVFRRIKDAL